VVHDRRDDFFDIIGMDKLRPRICIVGRSGTRDRRRDCGRRECSLLRCLMNDLATVNCRTRMIDMHSRIEGLVRAHQFRPPRADRLQRVDGIASVCSHLEHPEFLFEAFESRAKKTH